MASSSSSIPAQNSALTARSTASTNVSTIVPYFIAARRALLCWEQVSLAKTLVRSMRDGIEAQSIMKARTAYIRTECQAQLNTYRKVAEFTIGIRGNIYEAQQDVIQAVEQAKERLDKTITILKNTSLEENLIPKDVDDEEYGDSSAAKGNLKSLDDFSDKSGSDVCLERIDAILSTSSEELSTFEGSIESLRADAIKIRDMLLFRKRKSVDTKISTQDTISQNIDLLQVMEQQAVEMAKNLEDIVTQFDNCLTVMRHLEGGGAAVLRIAQETPAQMGLELAMEKPLEELTSEGLDELIIAIEKGHAELEYMVAEIRAGVDKVQTISKQRSFPDDYHKEELQTVVTAFHLLEELGNSLPTHVTQSQLYAIHWEEASSEIAISLQDLESLREHWMSFVVSYDYLLVEIGRRKDFERRLEKLRESFMSKVDKLMGEEMDVRNAFHDQHDHFLPSNICPELKSGPPAYNLIKEDNMSESLPDISASAIHKAIKRISLNEGRS